MKFSGVTILQGVEFSSFLLISEWALKQCSVFFKFQIFNGRTAEQGRTVSPCQIWSKSVKTRPIYGDFSIIQDGGRRHLGFFKFQIFNGRAAEEGRNASPCQIWSKSVKTRPRYGDFSIFQDGCRRHLGFFHCK